MEFIIRNETELEELAKQLIKSHPKKRIFFLKGDLGAGKTRFSQFILAQLGVVGSVSSPTFSIVNEYHSAQGPIYHMDLYRLKHEDELFEIGIEEYLYSGNYCFIEWPEILESIFDIEVVEIIIEISSQSERKILF